MKRERGGGDGALTFPTIRNGVEIGRVGVAFQHPVDAQLFRDETKFSRTKSVADDY